MDSKDCETVSSVVGESLHTPPFHAAKQTQAWICRAILQSRDAEKESQKEGILSNWLGVSGQVKQWFCVWEERVKGMRAKYSMRASICFIELKKMSKTIKRSYWNFSFQKYLITQFLHIPRSSIVSLVKLLKNILVVSGNIIVSAVHSQIGIYYLLYMMYKSLQYKKEKKHSYNISFIGVKAIFGIPLLTEFLQLKYYLSNICFKFFTSWHAFQAQSYYY